MIFDDTLTYGYDGHQHQCPHIAIANLEVSVGALLPQHHTNCNVEKNGSTRNCVVMNDAKSTLT